MGLARVECVSGCTCQPALVDGLWEQRVSLQQMHTFEARRRQLAACCLLGAPAVRRWRASIVLTLRLLAHTRTHPVQVSQHAACRLRVTIVPRSKDTPGGARPAGGGTKFQVASLVVAHTPVVLASYQNQAADLAKAVEG